MPTDILLILNRKSAARPDVRAAIKARAKAHGVEVRVPWSGKQMRKDMKRAVSKGCRRIIAGGGDGTLNAVANAIQRLGIADRVALGILPLGTANDLARGCGITADDLPAALDKALTGVAVPTDLGVVNGRHFINVASGGFGAMITATTPKNMKRSLGGLAYSLYGMSQLSEMRPQLCRFSLDGGAEREIAVSFMAIGNSRYAGGGFDVAPEAELDDGVLDLAIVGHNRQGAPGFLVRELLDPTNRDNEVLVYRTFQTCVLECDAPFHLNLDGEPLEAERFEIEVLPGALRLVR